MTHCLGPGNAVRQSIMIMLAIAVYTTERAIVSSLAEVVMQLQRWMSCSFT